jgi:serine/threonine protein kinase
MVTIGRYRREREIGRGAMGIVYLAHDPRLRRQVAVKTIALPDGLTETQHREYRERFLREAQAAAGLSHAGIVTIFDADEDPKSGAPYIAMEYVDGRSLQQRLETAGRLEPERAFAIVDLLAQALHHAHAAGIVHRDIKPANILLRDRDGTAKIADFGVARLPTSKLTRSGATIGSPAYMSPEQIRGGQVDGRSDLFALACILYECLCGQRPFPGDDLTQITYAVAHTEPEPITRRVPGLPAGLDRFFEQALAKDPALRFADGAALRDGLTRALEGHQPAAPTSTVIAQSEPSVAGSVVPPRSSDGAGMEQSIRPPWSPDQARPVYRRPAAVAFLVFFLLAGGWWAWGARRVDLKLDARSSIPSGTLTLTIDGEEVYERTLSTEEGGFFSKVTGRTQETFETWLSVAPGKHKIVALVVEEDGSEHRASVVIDAEPGEQREIDLVAGRALGRPLSLKAD